MTDEDYIRKAVKLADGWEYWPAKDGVCTVDRIRPPNSTYSVTAANVLPLYLDALAAQLVRQVDALPLVETFTLGAHARVLRDGSIISAEKGSDRTMNTIKAIIDSKVLE